MIQKPRIGSDVAQGPDWCWACSGCRPIIPLAGVASVLRVDIDDIANED